MLKSTNDQLPHDQDTKFAYRALRPDGAAARGIIAARDHAAAMAALGAQGLFPIEVSQQSSQRTGFLAPRMSAADLALGLRILSTLLDAGVPLRRVATTFDALGPASWSPVTRALIPALRDGRGLSAALTESQVGVPTAVIGMIRAGEASGAVAIALRAAADLCENTAATRAAVRSALAYPTVLAVTGVVSTSVLVGVVLPRFASLLGDIGQSIPPTTRLVLGASRAMRNSAPFVAAILVVIYLLLRAATSKESGKATWHAFLLDVPLLGQVRHAIATSRACATLGALLRSGVQMPQALEYASAASGDAAVAARLRQSRSSIIEGASLGGALDQTHAFTTAAIRLTRAGEETAQLPDMLSHASRLEGDRSAATVRRLVRLLEPTLILLFALAVGIVAAALLQAVYSVRPS